MNRAFFGEVRFRPARSPLAGRRLGDSILYCNLPDNQVMGFSPIDCSQIWASPRAGALPGAPPCAQSSPGNWIHPQCMGGAQQPPPEAPQAPAPQAGPPALACPQPDGRWTLVEYGPPHGILAENLTEAQFGQVSDNVTYLPPESACQDSRCAPICGEAPAPSAPTEPPPAPPPSIPSEPPSSIISPDEGEGYFPPTGMGPVPGAVPFQPAFAPRPQASVPVPGQRVPVKVPCGTVPVKVQALRTQTTFGPVDGWAYFS